MRDENSAKSPKARRAHKTLIMKLRKVPRSHTSRLENYSLRPNVSYGVRYPLSSGSAYGLVPRRRDSRDSSELVFSVSSELMPTAPLHSSCEPCSVARRSCPVPRLPPSPAPPPEICGQPAPRSVLASCAAVPLQPLPSAPLAPPARPPSTRRASASAAPARHPQHSCVARRSLSQDSQLPGPASQASS